MNRFLIAVAVIVVCGIGLGFYFGYLQVGWESSNGRTQITLIVDQHKIHGDEEKVVDKVHEKVHENAY
jgi:hypothetical protein